ncbi:MAG: DUF1259 domain-containing protein [Thermoproteota archaeon]|nr:DUF1259 domain-containing protein [Thermoproteota archaeon]
MQKFTKYTFVVILATTMMILPAIGSNSINMQNATAQSQAATGQATSQPPASQNNSQPQVGQQFIFNQNSKPANDPQKCAALGSVVNGKAIPDYNLCDIVVYRQAPALVRNDGFVLNNFSGLGHYIEMIPASVNDTSSFASSSAIGGGNNQTAPAGNTTGNNATANNLKVGFGEFALLDSEVIPVREVMQKYNWTETSLHHHMLGETPKVLFMHWSVVGDADALINQAKEMIMQTSTYQNLTGNSKTPTSAGP